MAVRVEAHLTLNEPLLEALYALEQQIFDAPYPVERLRRETAHRHHLLALLAWVDDRPVGYKIGYERTARVYYSWLGGVAPDHRGQGIARRLMAQQHAQAQAWGYRCVQTCTQNRYRDMLILNLRCGFDVVGLSKSPHDDAPVILLEKTL